MWQDLNLARVDPERRFMTSVFGGFAVLVIAIGVVGAWYGQDRVERGMASFAGSFVADVVYAHLQPAMIDGRSVYMAAPPSDTAWWHSFRSTLSPVLRGGGVHALDASGAIADVGSGERGSVPPIFGDWRQVVSGEVTQYLRASDPQDADVQGPVFGVVVPVVYAGAGGTLLSQGAIAIETSAVPLLREAHRMRDLVLLGTAAALVVLIWAFWWLARRLAQRSYRDSLTDLPNRRAFLEAGELMLDRCRRQRRAAAVVLADLNRFEEINHSLGSAVADGALQAFGRALAEHVRPGDHVARVGADEFAVLMCGASADEARLVAESVHGTLEGVANVDGRKLRLSASVGISMFPQDAVEMGTLLQCANTAMMRSKRSRLPFVSFGPGRGRRPENGLALEVELMDALREGHLGVHYQPIVAAATGERVAFEALARWNAATGPVEPGVFVPLAERTGLVGRLDRYVFEQAVRTLRALRRTEPTTYISVNLSAQTLADPTLPVYVRDVAQAHDVPARFLVLEVTEGVVAESLEATVARLRTLKECGFQLALDDFGTGYSSLAYLRQLPIDTVKIDRRFVAGIGEEPSDEELIRAIINYAGALKVRTLAEGVETTTQHLWLQREGVDFEQGYVHGRAQPIAIDAEI